MSLIYIAEDDASIRELLVSFLTTAGYDIEAFETGDALYEAFQQRPPHLIVLDVMMPGTDGFTICKNIRETSTVPIIVLTAKDSELDYVQRHYARKRRLFNETVSPDRPHDAH